MRDRTKHLLTAAFGAAALALLVPVLAFLVPSSASDTPAAHVVRYEAEGSGARGERSARYTLRTADGGTVQGTGISLPLRTDAGVGLTYAGFQSGDFVYLAVQNGDAAGAVTCRIVVDGVTISENTSHGGHTIASCSGEVP